MAAAIGSTHTGDWRAGYRTTSGCAVARASRRAYSSAQSVVRPNGAGGNRLSTTGRETAPLLEGDADGEGVDGGAECSVPRFVRQFGLGSQHLFLWP